MTGLPHILLAVTDGYTFCELAQELSAHNYPSTAVRTGREALEHLLGTNGPKVVILDRALRDMRGDDIVQKLRDHFNKPEDYVFCILLDSIGDGARRVPADSVLSYPVRPSRVLNSLNSVLRIYRRPRKSGIVRRRRVKPEVDHKVDVETGIWDRATIERHVEDALAHMRLEGGCVGVVRVRIDNFMDLGRRYGEAAESQALRTCSRLIRDQVRACEGIGRVGPAEMMIVTYGKDPNGATHVADRVQRAIAEFELKQVDQVIRFSTSIGAVVTWTENNAGCLYDAVNDALRQAARGEGDQIVAWASRENRRVAI